MPDVRASLWYAFGCTSLGVAEQSSRGIVVLLKASVKQFFSSRESFSRSYPSFLESKSHLILVGVRERTSELLLLYREKD